MRRLWVRWTLLVVFVAVLGSVFVNLGEWQLDRLDQRQQRNRDTLANEADPVVPFAQVFTRPIAEPDQWQRVEARGTFDADHQYVLRYRSNGGANGYEVVTPLRTPAGTVLVDRGFVRLAKGEPIPTAAPVPPAGEVTVVGHVRRDERGRGAATRPVDGQMRLISSTAIAKTLPYPVVNGYIGLLTVDPPQTGDFEPVLLPEISDGPHFWYAVQWFMFTAIGLAGVVVFIRGDLRARREERRVVGPRSARTRIGL
ncbi:Cytochrome oxidase assembly protein ShyY1 [Friedmanniella luteola]|uniref:SURF1-like protein n=1 Tax=Friedmanniella luteola TaxID=546871 RepID=A0A1H1PPX8_9ACTN|nr:SURF1 family protein [Friedmanniella luteola]SDS13155.1 Cytochrome oxidase assembly protein ShyY1 [Friedmanniella luteola]